MSAKRKKPIVRLYHCPAHGWTTEVFHEWYTPDSQRQCAANGFEPCGLNVSRPVEIAAPRVPGGDA